ncbi:MAG TPA: hypothetical protein VIH81_15750 [Roseiarcus sp.]
MNGVFAADREPDERKPRPHSEAAPLDELKRILTAKPQPFRIQFVGAAPGLGLTILREVEIQALGVSAAIVAAANLAFPPKSRPKRDRFSRVNPPVTFAAYVCAS